ncbi:MAG: spherulation-specific family 4 protein [Thermoplasmata archaeon]
MAILLVSTAVTLNYEKTHNNSIALNQQYRTGLIVPLYFDPNESWSELISIHRQYPDAPMVVIINPDSGSGNSSSGSYLYWTQMMKSSGISVLGYVYTSYGQRSPDAIEQQALNYSKWYKVNGIFLDEVPDSSQEAQFYKNVVLSIRELGLQYIVGNPGTYSPNSITSCFNLTVLYENPGLPGPGSFTSIVNGTSRANSSMISFNVPYLEPSWLESATKYFSFIYITNLGPPNPYDGLPSYILNEMQILSLQ